MKAARSEVLKESLALVINTIMKLLVIAGEKCEKFLENRIKDIPVKDVECDELWCFVGMKEKTKGKKRLQWDSYEQERSIGDAYTFVGFRAQYKAYSGLASWAQNL